MSATELSYSFDCIGSADDKRAAFAAAIDVLTREAAAAKWPGANFTFYGHSPETGTATIGAAIGKGELTLDRLRPFRDLERKQVA